MNTVLVVDDDSEIRDIIHVYLRNEGYHVLEAEDGLEALNKIKINSSIQLVILDVMMPRMDGMKACLKIKEISNIRLSCCPLRKKTSIKLQVLLPELTIT